MSERRRDRADDEDLDLHLAAATETAAAARGMTTIAKRYAFVGIALVHALAGLARALNRFARAIEARED